MNRLKLLFGFSFLFLLSISVNAQTLKVPKANVAEYGLPSQLSGILNDTSGLDLNADKKDKLTKENSKFVDELMNISKSSKSDDDKKTAFLNLKSKRTKLLTSLLGNDLFKKYSGKILQSINPLKSKLGLAALAF